uniref:tRNA-uridine aminocarboxypropyltransferase 1 n=1 Tax=Panagrellus redivivus TaxID=6233 RepID=A0A7E4UX11_PANRE
MPLASFDGLEGLSKVHCPKCHAKRMYFCYDCLVYMPGVSEVVPSVTLPVAIDVVKNPVEKNSKSTAVHAVLLANPDGAPASIHASDGPLPNFTDAKLYPNTVLVFPDPKATTVADYVAAHGPVQRFVFLDSTWFTVKSIRQRPELNTLPTVMLRSYETEYWRPQKGMGPEFLATIEAIHHAIKENSEAVGDADKLDIDNLLYWFYFFKKMVGNETKSVA